ncbi:hypothetical protein JYU14_04210 [Simkania negevensis]|uniref:Flagellin n=1 Tax=Simkania negevensis TaxID=83561 RepID=A0ABS3AUH3_9BACT|nr:hypothetical protein [Simkania negevensis]
MVGTYLLTNSLAIPVHSNYRFAVRSMFNSMSRISSGSKLNRPGEGPAEFGIAESFRFQIHNSNEANRGMGNAMSMVSSADSWMQSSQDILSRMGELAISGSDASKNSGDRANIDLEFQQLKSELSRIARQAKYSSLNVAGRDQMVIYNKDKETLQFSQLDGSQNYTYPVKLLNELSSVNDVQFAISANSVHANSLNGEQIYYIDNNRSLSRLDIEEGTLARDSSSINVGGLSVDEKGRLWFLEESASTPGVYSLHQQNSVTWREESAIVDGTQITDIASKQFSVYADRVYYLNTGGNIVSRSLFSPGNVNIELTPSTLSFVTTDGKFAISQDGLYLIDSPSSSVVRVVNLETQENTSFQVGENVAISALTISADNRELVFVDSNTNDVMGVKFEAGEKPTLGNVYTILEPTGLSGFGAFSLLGGSNRSNFRVHTGGEALQQMFVQTGDVRLYTLGLSRSSVDTIDKAQKSLAAIQKAIDRVTLQRSIMGAAFNRIESSVRSQQTYTDYLSIAESLLRDADIAEESALLAAERVKAEVSTSLLVRANQVPKALLRILAAR